MKFTLRQLEVFLAVAHHENLSKAAESLSMSQSAASSALKDLEQLFDIQLFDRIGKRLQINELGRLTQAKADALLVRANEVEMLLERHQQLGDLNVGATLTIGNYLCVSIMAQYMAEQPDSKVSLTIGNTLEVARKVEQFELDIGLIEGELHHSELDIIHWRDDELVVFCHPDHLLAKKRVLSDEDLLSANWILREQGSGTRQAFDRAMFGLLPELNVTLELQHTEAIKRAVEANLGVACLSKIALQDPFVRGSLIPLAVSHRDLKRHFYFILHKQKYRTAGINHWIDLCMQRLA